MLNSLILKQRMSYICEEIIDTKETSMDIFI